MRGHTGALQGPRVAGRTRAAHIQWSSVQCKTPFTPVLIPCDMCEVMVRKGPLECRVDLD